MYDTIPKEKEVVSKAESDSEMIIQELRWFPRAKKLEAIQRYLDQKYQPWTFTIKESINSAEIEVFINCLPGSWFILSAAWACLPVDKGVEQFAFTINL